MTLWDDVLATRRAFENYVRVGVLGGLALPGRIPPRRGWRNLMNRRLEFRTRRGVVLETELGNAWPIVEIFRDSHYDIPIEWPSVRRVLDVGGHVGAFTTWVATRAPYARITTFEPEPRNFRDLHLNVERNRLSDRISLVNAAVTAKDGRRGFNVRLQRDSSSLAPTDAALTIVVDCVALERFLRECCSEPVDVLKLDCEGAEWEILPSLSDESFGRIANVLLECHAGRDDELEAMIEQLAARGFDVRVLSTGSAPGLFPRLATVWAARR